MSNGKEARRVLIIGLDCAPPSLVFERWADRLPHLSALRRRGIGARLRSTEPPITVPAWACMASGRDPGELGLYGFRNMGRNRDYGLRVANSRDVPVKRLWERAGEAGKRVASLFVPLTSPPTPVRGTMVSGFLTPPGARWAFPPAKEKAFEARFGPYQADVEDFRSDALERIFHSLHSMREQHFAMAEAVWAEERPDFMMMVEMGPDRLHHAAWHHLDSTHPAHDPESRWAREGRAYYEALDASVGALIDRADDALVMVVSDHGAKTMRGGIALNEILLRSGWLTLGRTPQGAEPLRECVDWTRTKAWAEGGYYARVFFNVAGREPQGTVPAARLLEEREALARMLTDALAEHGVRARCERPETRYAAVRGHPPDLMVYLDELDVRAFGTVGHDDVWVSQGELGVDGCNHDWDGILIAAPPRSSQADAPETALREEALGQASILDVAPTALAALALPHDDLPGRSLWPQITKACTKP